MTILDAQRRVTQSFIDTDPTDIILTPHTDEVTGSGGRARVAGDPRDVQTFKVIPMTFDQRPTVTAGGVERIIDYTLLGAWDCVMEVGDTWTLVEGAREYYEVVAITDGHGYERKGLCERHLFKDGEAV